MLLFSGPLYADTIRTTDGKELKGMVVEDYKDRVVFSTVDGEKVIAKSKIKELFIDSEEDNLIRLAEKSTERGEYGKAYEYYSTVLKMDPGSKKAKDGMTYLQGFLFRQEEIRKENEVKRQEVIDRYGAMIEPEKPEDDTLKESAANLKDRYGMSLAITGGFPVVENVSKEMEAYQAGVRKGDLLISVWGKLTGYMKPMDVMDALLRKAAFEIKCVIERTVEVKIADRGLFSGPISMIGSSFSMELEGLTVSGVADGGPSDKVNIEKGDLIMAIDGQPTRYMPLRKAVSLIKGSGKDTVKLTIRKEVVLWRNGG